LLTFLCRRCSLCSSNQSNTVLGIFEVNIQEHIANLRVILYTDEKTVRIAIDRLKVNKRCLIGYAHKMQNILLVGQG
jgi:hypothetical protein